MKKNIEQKEKEINRLKEEIQQEKSLQSPNIENNSDEITIKIRAMDNNFIINIKRNSTIKDLKEKIASVNIIIL